MSNKECKLKFCSECGVRMQQQHIREAEDYIILTRHCPQCGKNVHVVEMEREEYNKSVEVLNKIINFIAEL
jgi:DNA-directed RNA polymerase subunit M/transcription elongation factor TFIIS